MFQDRIPFVNIGRRILRDLKFLNTAFLLKSPDVRVKFLNNNRVPWTSFRPPIRAFVELRKVFGSEIIRVRPCVEVVRVSSF